MHAEGDSYHTMYGSSLTFRTDIRLLPFGSKINSQATGGALPEAMMFPFSYFVGAVATHMGDCMLI